MAYSKSGNKRPENHFSGMLVIRKEAGYTSSDVVAKLRGILHMRKIGHTGTLDPMAEGVLPVCLGSATKLAELIADRDKEYVARLRLGVTTDTQDMTGTVLEEKPVAEVREILRKEFERRRVFRESRSDEVSITGNSTERKEEGRVRAEDGPDSAFDACGTGVVGEADTCEALIRAAARQFVGEIEQIPPMYSAVWSNGKRLYDLARKGVTVERTPRKVRIFELEVQGIELPYVTLRVVCSKGTYIRTLCEDLGNALGTGGAMEHLLRTRVGTFTLGEALTLDEVQALMKPDQGAVGSATESSWSGDHIGIGFDVRGSSFSEGTPESEAISAAGASTCCEGEKRPTSSVQSENTVCKDSIENHIIPVDRFFSSDPAVHVRDEDLKYLKNGNPLSGSNTVEGRIPHTERVRVYDERGEFYALYRYEKSRRRILPVKMFHETESVRSDRRGG